jgi:hypothetical protein
MYNRVNQLADLWEQRLTVQHTQGKFFKFLEKNDNDGT